MITAADIGGVHIKYLYHCPRQLWLFARGFRPESLNATVQLGEAVHETSYRRKSEIDLGAARLDFIDGEHWVHEVKSARTSTPADQAQGGPVHIPITDVRDVVACAPVDINTAVISLLNQHHISVHLLSHYGDYAGSVLAADTATSGETVLAQARLATDPTAGLEIAKDIVRSTAFNVRRIVDRDLLSTPYAKLVDSVRDADSTDALRGAEGTFRRSAWQVLDTHLPEWLQLDGRSRRPPRNAGNAFISYVNGITYARVLTAIRLTPLHSGIAFLHSTMERQRHSLALDLAEVFKPLFAERLLLRLANRKQLRPEHFDSDVNQAMLSDIGRNSSYKPSETNSPSPYATAN